MIKVLENNLGASMLTHDAVLAIRRNVWPPYADNQRCEDTVRQYIKDIQCELSRARRDTSIVLTIGLTLQFNGELWDIAI